MGTRGHAFSLGWGKILQEIDKFGGVSGNWWGFCVSKTSVWCDAEDCSWGCVLFFTGS